MTIYVTAFTYLSECYGIYASSAIAAQSFLRNMMGGAFSFFTTAMFDGMTVRWALVLMGGVAALLALVPFVAFFYGPQIRARSKYSRELMAQEREALEKEREAREKRGMDTADAEETIVRALSRTSHDHHSLSLHHSRSHGNDEKV
jgi:type II secretory pathway component PulM